MYSIYASFLLILFCGIKNAALQENIKTELHELFDDYYKWLLEIHPQSASWVSQNTFS